MAIPTKTYSVQPRFAGRSVQPTGWAWIDYLFRTFRKSNIPAYGTWQRDVYLAEIWKIEPILAGIYNAFIERVQTRQWKVTGGRINATRGARALNASEGGLGFEYMLGLWAGDFIHTDKGVFGEKGRRRKGAIVGPVLSLQHIDATRMVRNFRRDTLPTPRKQSFAHWVYLPQEGEPVRVPDQNLIRIIPQPSGRDKFRGQGYCATSRIHDALEMMLGFLIYYRQKIGNLPPQLIAIINGMTMEQFEAAYAAYEVGRKTKDSDVYPGIFFLGSDDPATPVSITTSQFSGLPDGFDWMQFAEWWVKVAALNIGEASGEYWLLQHAGIGQAGYAVQSQTARGRGAGKFIYDVGMRLNLEVMPHGATFSFDAPDDEQDQQRAEILATNMATIERMAKSGAERGELVFTVDEIRQAAIEIGVLDQEVAGEDVPFAVGAMLKSVVQIDEPQIHVCSDGRIIEIKPLLTGKSADAARELYKVLEGYYVPRMQHKVASLEGAEGSPDNGDPIQSETERQPA